MLRVVGGGHTNRRSIGGCRELNVVGRGSEVGEVLVQCRGVQMRRFTAMMTG